MGIVAAKPGCGASGTGVCPLCAVFSASFGRLHNGDFGFGDRGGVFFGLDQHLRGDGFRLGWKIGWKTGEAGDSFLLGVGCHIDDEGGGAETERWRGFRVAYAIFDGAKCARGEFDGSIVPIAPLFAAAKFQFTGEGGDGAAPIAYCVAVYALHAGGRSDAVAGCDELDDAELLFGQRGVG